MSEETIIAKAILILEEKGYIVIPPQPYTTTSTHGEIPQRREGEKNPREDE